MTNGLFPGFTRHTLPGEGTEIDAMVGGDGPPLLLLHGWPETRTCWAKVAPALAKDFTVVVPDLRGYGRSGKPPSEAGAAAYAKRIMALDQIATMRALGHDRFMVAGHDRGGRVAYRLALDHPEVVTRLAVLDIVPTADVWGSMDATGATKMWHWPFLAQPDALPETLIGANPEFFLRYILDHQSGPGFRFDAAHVADYITAWADPEAIRGACEDYRAGHGIDRALDEADRGRPLAMPLLVLWGEHGSLAGKDALAIWSTWAADLRGEQLPGGHFVPEEAPDETIDRLRTFFGDA
jgi:haloacetate dehalogenase